MSEFDPSQTDVVICTDKKLTHLADGVRVAKDQPTDPEDTNYTKYTLDEIEEAVPSIVSGNVDKFIFEKRDVAIDKTWQYVNIYSSAKTGITAPGAYCKNIILPNATDLVSAGWWRTGMNTGSKILPDKGRRETNPDKTYYFYAPNLKNVGYDETTETWHSDSIIDGTIFGNNYKYNLDSLEYIYSIGSGNNTNFCVPTVNLPNLKGIYSDTFWYTSTHTTVLKNLYLPKYVKLASFGSNNRYLFQHQTALKNVYAPSLRTVVSPNWQEIMFNGCSQLEELCLWSFLNSITPSSGLDSRCLPGIGAASLKRIIFPKGDYVGYINLASGVLSSGKYTNILNHFASPEYDPNEDPAEWGMFVDDDYYDQYISSSETNYWNKVWTSNNIVYTTSAIKPISTLPQGYIDKYRPGRTFDQFMQDFNIPAEEDPRMGLLTDQEIDDLYHDRYNPN